MNKCSKVDQRREDALVKPVKTVETGINMSTKGRLPKKNPEKMWSFAKPPSAPPPTPPFGFFLVKDNFLSCFLVMFKPF